MINGLGVLGWGVGGIEAEAAMLGQPMSMLIPQVIGFKLTGALPEGATATDLVLTVTEQLRKKGVVGKFVEFFGPGVAALPLADRATIGNMSPEFGSTCAIFPIDAETLRYLEFSGRPQELVDLVEAYAKEQGLWHDEDSEEPTYSDTVELDLSGVVPSLAGPKRPQDRVSLSEAKEGFRAALSDLLGDDAQTVADSHDEAEAESFPASDPPANGSPGHAGPHEVAPAPAVAAGARLAERSTTAVDVTLDGEEFKLDHGHVVIAAITSCTNTSNPSVMLGAGLVARNAVARGLQRQPWVKTSLAPGSKVVTEYLERAGLDEPLDELGFNLVGYGCTTCIGNSGPLPEEISAAVDEGDLAVVLGALRQPQLRGAHQPRREDELPRIAAAGRRLRAGRDDGHRPRQRPAGHRRRGQRRLPQGPLADREGGRPDRRGGRAERHVPLQLRRGLRRRRALERPRRARGRPLRLGRGLDLRAPAAVLRGLRPPSPSDVTDIEGARVLAKLGDSVTTDHISPAGAIKEDSPAGAYLKEHGVETARLQLLRLAPRQPRGDGARHVREHPPAQPARAGDRGRLDATDADGEELSIYDAAMAYAEEGTPLVVLGGKEYGSGSSRDWAAKGTNLLGVRAVIAESFERIHRSNLVGMGVLPLQFPDGEGAESLGLSGEEEFTITGLAEPLNAGELPRTVQVKAGDVEFEARVRIDTPKEADYFRHGGILQYVLRSLAA